MEHCIRPTSPKSETTVSSSATHAAPISANGSCEVIHETGLVAITELAESSKQAIKGVFDQLKNKVLLRIELQQGVANLKREVQRLSTVTMKRNLKGQTER